MRTIDTLRLAARVLRNNRLRTILTILGIGIANGAIIYLISLGMGLQDLTIGSIARSNTLLTMDVIPAKGGLKELTASEIEEIRGLPKVAEVARALPFKSQLENGQMTIDATALAADANLLSLEAIDLVAGRYFGPGEMVVTESLAKVSQLATPQLVGRSMDVLVFASQTGPLQKLTLTIAGVIKSTLPTETIAIYLPLSAVEGSVSASVSYPNLKVRAESLEDIESVRQAIADRGFSVRAIVDTVGQVKKTFRIFQIVLAVIGVIALVVASIGMFNTLTISLLERTKEVGILRALGASKGNIFYLFLAEAIIIGLVGGLASWLVAGLAQLISRAILSLLAVAFNGQGVDIFANPPLLYVGMLGFGTLVAFLTGFYPARRAARLNPIDAIRYE